MIGKNEISIFFCSILNRLISNSSYSFHDVFRFCSSFKIMWHCHTWMLSTKMAQIIVYILCDYGPSAWCTKDRMLGMLVFVVLLQIGVILEHRTASRHWTPLQIGRQSEVSTNTATIKLYSTIFGIAFTFFVIIIAMSLVIIVCCVCFVRLTHISRSENKIDK